MRSLQQIRNERFWKQRGKIEAEYFYGLVCHKHNRNIRSVNSRSHILAEKLKRGLGLNDKTAED